MIVTGIGYVNVDPRQRFYDLMDTAHKALQNLVGKAFTKLCPIDQDFTHYLFYYFEAPEGMTNAQVLYEMLCGAYIVLPDNKATYQLWRTHEEANNSTSSHASEDAQFRIDTPFFGSLLMGTRDNQTWFQLERHPLTLLNFIPHMFTYILYLITGRNQGPHGSSPHREGHRELFLRRKAENPFALDNEVKREASSSLSAHPSALQMSVS